MALKEVGGLNQISLTSKYGICLSSNVYNKQLYRFDVFEFLIDFLDAAFDIKYVEPTISTITSSGGKGNNLTEFE